MGGAGGTSGANGTTLAINATGGAGGAATSGFGDVKVDGSAGAWSLRIDATHAVSGMGGASEMGGGARSVTVLLNTQQFAGSPGGLYGGGGSGAATATTTGTIGGAGGQGVIRITEFK